MEFAGRHLAAICREIVTLARRSREQQRQLDVHAEHLAALEQEVTAIGRPPPLRVARSDESGAVESLTRSFESRLGSPDDDA